MYTFGEQQKQEHLIPHTFIFFEMSDRSAFVQIKIMPITIRRFVRLLVWALMHNANSACQTGSDNKLRTSSGLKQSTPQ